VGGGIVPCCPPTGPGSVTAAGHGTACSPPLGLAITVVLDSASESLESNQSAWQRKTRLCSILALFNKLLQDNEQPNSVEHCSTVCTLIAQHCKWLNAVTLTSLLGGRLRSHAVKLRPVSLRAWTVSRNHAGRRCWRVARVGGTGRGLSKSAADSAAAAAAAVAVAVPWLAVTS